MRALIKGTFMLWGLMAALALIFSNSLLTRFQIANPAALWVTLLLGLASLWSPIILGVLQGRQNFLWLGWANMLNGLTRLCSVTVIVLLLGGWAAGGMTGVLLGMMVALGIGLWQTADLWRGPAATFDWLPWLKRMVPITLGFGAVTFMLTQDMLVVQEFFPREETGYYGAAGMIGRALYFFTAPVASVLFPKLVQSAARAQKTSVLAQAVGATALLGVGAATFCTLFPTVPLRLVYNETFLRVAPLVPLFAWCMLPLILSSVLVNNLLARERFAAVPFLVAVAAGYYVTLRFRHDSFESVIQTLGLFGSVLLAVCLFFSWREARTANSTP
jgi:O-antigen/teichoic acid export membrane protein